MFSIALLIIAIAFLIECARRDLLSFKREIKAGKWPVDGHYDLDEAQSHRQTKRALQRELRAKYRGIRRATVEELEGIL